MSVTLNTSAVVTNGTTPVSLSSLFTATAASTNPTYLVVTALDRNEYTAGATGATGTLSGNGHTATDVNIDNADGRGIGIVFTYSAATGQYVNATYGNFSQMTYNPSASNSDLTTLSVFTTSNVGLTAAPYANSAFNMYSVDSTGLVGTATIATQPTFAPVVNPATNPNATPGSIASIAQTFVGHAWNMNGCWVLASTIAAEAGAGLPVDSTMIAQAGSANGEWFVSFDGSKNPTGAWQSTVKAGEIVVIGNSSFGHITTVVSGSGSTAMLVDNMTQENSAGAILNPANDGSTSDITILAPHAASQEWAGVSTLDVKIYELDCPVVTATKTTSALALKGSVVVSSLASAADPNNTAITTYQVYDTVTTDSITVGGVTVSAHSAATAATASSLSQVCLVAGATACTDTLEVRAENSLGYWGDWQAMSVTVTGTTSLSNPTVALHTANQLEAAGRAFTIAVPAGTFSDPNGLALTYGATQSNGSALPTWMSFNAVTDVLSGTAPVSASTAPVSVSITATDTAGLSVSETFTVGVTAAAPTLVLHTANQSWLAGNTVNFTVPVATFSDPNGQALTYGAAQSNGNALPSWLHFNATSDTFSGVAPASASQLSLVVTATDASGLSTSETFNASIIAPPVLVSQTATQAATAGKAFTIAIPASTFSDPNGQALTVSASQSNGAPLPTWITFNAATDTLSGTAPTAASTTAVKLTATDASGLSVSETFNLTVTANTTTAAHTLTTAAPIQDQTWTAGQKVSFAVPAGTFVDSQGQHVGLAEYQLSGPSTSSWLTFNASTGTFSGIVPTNVVTGTAQLEVLALDTSGLMATDVFAVHLVGMPSAPHGIALVA